MEITLTDAQYEQLKKLFYAINGVRPSSGSEAGEIEVNETKVTWEENEVEFTLSD